MSTILMNIYRDPAELFVGGEVLLSCEGTTQGDPLAMAMYGLSLVPLIQQLACEAKQIWFADDATGGGKLRQLKGWWDKLNEIGSVYGYFPNACKTWLLVKVNQLKFAQDLFSKTGVQITTEGCHLEDPDGTTQFCNNVQENTVATRKKQLEIWCLWLKYSQTLRMQHLHTNLPANIPSW